MDGELGLSAKHRGLGKNPPQAPDSKDKSGVLTSRANKTPHY